MTKNIQIWFFTFLIAILALSAPAKAAGGSGDDFDIGAMIKHHLLDSHEWEFGETSDGTHITLPLPVILIHDGSPYVFLSSAFHSNEAKKDSAGNHYVAQDGNYFLLDHHSSKIYVSDAEGNIQRDAEGNKIAPLDFSITKNVASMLISAILLLFVFFAVAKGYKTRPNQAPKGIQAFFEPIVEYLQKEVITPNIGEKKAGKYMPYLLTVFFFIWFNNLLGLIPGGTNTSGNIAFTGVLAAITLVVTVFSGNKGYWAHIFATPGVPKPLLVIMIPIEVIGIFTKPFALMIRLFANIMAGHTLILSLVGLIFLFRSVVLGIPVTLFVIPMMCLELFVALLQAYIFTLLSSLFIGQAVEEAHH
ncbi:MAG: F0F1 ATP synthase subunit A [Bernardetiaceae bacterium]|nr:F0F1 ATP synthase subunit A [Bernardetiaceae bacterium]